MARPRPIPSASQQGSQDGWFVGPIARFWQRSYAAEYLGLVLLFAGYLLMATVVEPFHRMFSLDNLAIQYPHAVIERVPVFWNIASCVVLPLSIIALWALVLRPSIHEVHVTILGLLISIMLTTFLTDVVKNAVGRPRPDLIARCKPKEGTPQHELVTIDVCSETDHHVLHDGWRSFPSGHSSLAFSGLGFLAIFFAGQMHIFRPRTDFARVLLALSPLVGAALIAISRLEDYRHDVYDVTIGSILGITIAYFSYRRHYPRLKSPQCDLAHPSRAEIALMNGSGKLKDEEERIRSARRYSSGSTDEEAERVPLQETNRDRETLVRDSSE